MSNSQYKRRAAHYLRPLRTRPPVPKPPRQQPTIPVKTPTTTKETND
jgi:hypothetical protein